MSPASLLARLPVDAMAYEVTLLLLAAAFAVYAVILRTLLGLVGRSSFWLLPLIGSILLVAAALLHGFAAAQLGPLIPLDPGMYVESMRLRSWSTICLLGCGILSLTAAWMYYIQVGTGD